GSIRCRPSPNGRERRGSRNRWRWRTPRRPHRSPDRSHGRRWSWQSSFLFGVARGSRVARGSSPTLWRKPRRGNALLSGRRDLEHLVSSLGLTPRCGGLRCDDQHWGGLRWGGLRCDGRTRTGRHCYGKTMASVTELVKRYYTTVDAGDAD